MRFIFVTWESGFDFPREWGGLCCGFEIIDQSWSEGCTSSSGKPCRVRDAAPGGTLPGWQPAAPIHSRDEPEPPKSSRAPPAAAWLFLWGSQDTTYKGRAHSFHFLVNSSSFICFLLCWISPRGLHNTKCSHSSKDMGHFGGWVLGTHRNTHMAVRGLKVVIPACTVSALPGDPVLLDEKSYKCKVLLAHGFVVSHPQATLRFLMFLGCSL